jgi:alkylation response protein AidB-like acyl-CoA dehydrogenase
MSANEQLRNVSAQESRDVAEASRQTDVRAPGFLKEMFLGNFRLDLIHPFPQPEERPEFRKFFDEMKAFLRDEVDSAEIDRTGEYPPHVIDRLRAMGAFGMKIPTEYGGLGFTQVEYDRVMKLLGTADANLTALLSAHQSIGVPQPLKIFGTEEQKKKFLPRLARGAISAFALTERDVGSDPARLATTAVPDGDHYVLNGRKLWCTNGTIAELIVVMALNPETKKISALIVEMNAPGVVVEHRCRFMGLKALANAELRFDNVRVPKENLIGREGEGLKIALITLNTGRLALPAGCVGASKLMLEISRTWSNARVQWGMAVGRHEAVAHKIADMAATTFAMESVADLASALADRKDYDIRIEAAAAKEYGSEQGWRLVDETMQIRGGRGYETEHSLAARGEKPIGVERAMRDSRINRIFEGSTEIMHLFIAREAVDKHLKVAGALVNPKASAGQKLAALPAIAAFYATWYPTRYLGWGRWPRYGEFGPLATHLRFAERSTRRLARAIFHGMVVHQAGLERRQGFLGRIVKIGIELFAITAAVSRAHTMALARHEHADQAAELADLFCRDARRRVRRWFTDLWLNDDRRKYNVARNVLDSRHIWLEQGGLTLADREAALMNRLHGGDGGDADEARPREEDGQFVLPTAAGSEDLRESLASASDEGARLA